MENEKNIFEHMNFTGLGESPMTLIFSAGSLTGEEKDRMEHMRIDMRTERIFDDRETELAGIPHGPEKGKEEKQGV